MESVIKRGNLDEIRLAIQETDIHSCLCWAIKYQHKHVVDYLLQCETNINPQEPVDDMQKPLYCAVVNHDLDMFIQLYKHGAQLYIDGDENFYLRRVIKANCLDILKFLTSTEVNFNLNNSSALIWAVESGNMSILEHLMDVYPNLTDYHIFHALQHACSEKNLDMVEYLLKYVKNVKNLPWIELICQALAYRDKKIIGWLCEYIKQFDSQLYKQIWDDITNGDMNVLRTYIHFCISFV